MKKQKIILNAYSSPQFLDEKMLVNEQTVIEHSNVCVDDLKLNLEFKNNYLVKANHNSIGCAVFIASVEIMLKQILNKSKEQIKTILEAYQYMIEGNKINESQQDILNDLVVFENVKIHLNRLECASIILRAINRVIL